RERAKQYYTSMEDAYGKGNYDACTGNAVHCAISAVDAFTVMKLGRKSSAQNHNEIILLLKEARTTDEAEKARVCEKLYELLSMKTIAEYDDRQLSKADADRARTLCEKIYSFLESEVERMEDVLA
ncbi:MAG: HEPN domain-containing protein, partial [Candidatus Micrarchaeota archaeon]